MKMNMFQTGLPQTVYCFGYHQLVKAPKYSPVNLTRKTCMGALLEHCYNVIIALFSAVPGFIPLWFFEWDSLSE